MYISVIEKKQYLSIKLADILHYNVTVMQASQDTSVHLFPSHSQMRKSSMRE